MNNRINKFFLWNIFALYILVTLLCYLFGPIEYDQNYPIKSTLFMICFLLVARFFYSLGCSARIKSQRKITFGSRRLFKLNERNFVSFCLVFSFFLCGMLLLENILQLGFSFSGNFFTQMASTYTDTKAANTISSYVVEYFGWTKTIAIVGGMYYLKQLSKRDKLFLLGTISFTILYVIMYVGSQKQIIDIMIYVLVGTYLRSLKNGNGLSDKFKRGVKYILVITVLVLIVGNVIVERFNLWLDRYNSTALVSTGQIDFNHILFRWLPLPVAFAVTQFISYISQGYRGLSLCLSIPFKWAYGMGSSFRFMRDFSRWTGIRQSLLEVSYPVRMQAEFGVNAYAYWHTIFPWVASDFTWIGAILVVGIFIFYWAKAWNEFIIFDTLPSVLVVAHLSIMMLYIPCNNQLFQTRESIVTTFFILVFWFLFHGITPENQLQE